MASLRATVDCVWFRAEIMAQLKSHYEFEYLRAKYKAKQELIAKGE